MLIALWCRYRRAFTKTLLIMNLTAIIVLSVCLCASAHGYSQTVTLREKNASLEAVLKKIQQQSGYKFIYTLRVIEKARPVNIDVKNATVEEALDRCFKNQPLHYAIVEKVVVVKEKPVNVTPPPIDIRGRIIDDNGKPVVATVLVKGTSLGTTSNDNGEFELKGVADNATLVVSGVGIEPFEVRVNGRTDLTLNAKIRVTSNEEVVVSTGYQQLPKERATGSFDHINSRQLSQQVSTTILGRLEALANGLATDRITSSSGKMVIRGLSTIFGPRDPLIVLDNFPYEGDISNINPNDVEKITILKDAAAASIWGARAGNGVVVITTKKSRLNQPLRFGFTANTTIAGKPDLSYLKQISSTDFIDAELFLFENRHRWGDTASSSRPPFSPVYEILFQRRNGQISSADSAAQIDALRNHDIRSDYDRYIYQATVNLQYALDVRGGTNNYSWYVSGGFDRNVNQTNAHYQRFNLRFSNLLKISDRLQVEAAAYLTDTRTKNGKPEYGGITSMASAFLPYTRLADAEGQPVAILKDYRSAYIDTAGGGRLLNWNYVPLEDFNHISNTSSLQDMLINFTARYRLLDGLEASAQIQYEKQKTEGRSVQDENSYYSRSLVNRFSQIDFSTGRVTYAVPKGGILDLQHATLSSFNTRAQLNYNKSWKKSEVSALAGIEIREQKIDETRYRLYGYNDDVLTFGNVDLTRTYPDYVTKNSAYIPQNQGLVGKNNRIISAFANFGYSYEGKYQASFSARRDGSNLFGASTNDRWKPLYSLGAAWQLSREAFYRSRFFPQLKLRMTWGYSGNADPSKVGVTTIRALSPSIYTGTPIAIFDNYYNPELKWETIRMANIGLDFSAVYGRITGSVEYYSKKGSDLFGTAPVDYTAIGTNQLMQNVAEIKASGIDVQLHSRNIDGHFKWQSTVNFSANKDEVTKYYQSTVLGSNFVTSSVRISGVEGKPIYSLFSYRWAGLDPQTGDPQGYYNKTVSKSYNNLVNDSLQNLVYNGPLLPRIFGSVLNSFSYRNFSLHVAILYKFGHYFRRSSIHYANFYSGWFGHPDIGMRWQQPGDEQFTSVPSMIYPTNANRDAFYNGSEVLIEKADHIRLQYITLNYEFNDLFSAPFLKNMNVYLNINNVGLLWKANRAGIDPEYTGSYTMPPVRNYALGFKTSF